MDIMLDVDGVLRDFNHSWKATWREWTGERAVSDPTSWRQIAEAAKYLGLPEQEALDYIFREKGFEVMAEAEPYPCAMSFVNFLKSCDHRVIIGTHQMTPETRAGTRAWLSRTGIGPLADLIVFTGVKASIVADVYIDDRVETLLDLQQRRPLSLILAPNRPWNQRLGRMKSVHRPVVAYDDLYEIASIFKGKGTTYYEAQKEVMEGPEPGRRRLW